MQGDRMRLDRLSAALAAAGDLAYDWDLERDRIAWLGPVESLLPLAGEALTRGSAFAALIEPQDRPVRAEALARHAAAGDAFECVYRLRLAGGTRWAQERGAAELDASGRPVRLSGLLRPQRAGEAGTILPGRAQLLAAAAGALAFSLDSGRAGACLAIDIDNLTRINDAFGFDAGDTVIAEIGARLQRLLRGRDMIVRMEGGRFGLLLDNCDKGGAAAAADRILRVLRAGPVETAAGPIAATLSLGGVIFPADARRPEELVSHAELALQEAKRAGRNHYMLYRASAAQRQLLRHGNSLVHEIQRALAEDRLMIAYQPVLEARSGAPAFHECLLRLRREDGEILPAGQFVPLVEPLGMMRQIDRRMLELAIRELEADPDAMLAFNISGMTVGDRQWLADSRALLRDRPDLAGRLVVELTETAALLEIEESVRFVWALRDLGCRVALDDFGAGYSSFQHLKALPVDIVKIDGSFVRDLLSSPESRLFIRTLLDLANAFGVASVAECVETAKQADILAQEGATYVQGWYCGRPALTRPPRQAQPTLPRRAAAE